VHDDALLSRDILHQDAGAHCFGITVECAYGRRCGLLLGLCRKVAQATAADQVPGGARDGSARWRQSKSTIGGLVHGQN